MRYLLENGETFEEDQKEDLIEYCIPDDYYADDYDGFNDYLNDEYGSITIEGNTYYAATILSDYDEDDYDNAKSTWEAERVENDRELAQDQVASLRVGEHTYIGLYRVEAVEEENEEEEEEEDCVRETSRRQSTVEEIKQILSNQYAEEVKQQEENTKLEDSFMKIFTQI